MRSAAENDVSMASDRTAHLIANTVIVPRVATSLFAV
jgi:hypothetical protein